MCIYKMEDCARSFTRCDRRLRGSFGSACGGGLDHLPRHYCHRVMDRSLGTQTQTGLVIAFLRPNDDRMHHSIQLMTWSSYFLRIS